LPACIASLVISFFVTSISSEILIVMFGTFLILLGVIQIVIFSHKKMKNGKCGGENKK